MSLKLSAKREGEGGIKFNQRIVFQTLYQSFCVLVNLIIPELWIISRTSRINSLADTYIMYTFG